MRASKLLTLVPIAAAAIAVLSLIAISDLGNRDYISYWAAGNLLSRNLDPYDYNAVLRAERSMGLAGMQPMIMRNPPFMLPITLILSILGANLGAVVWTTGILLSIAICVHMTRQRRDQTHLIGYLFAPGLACLMAGQSGALLLAGVVLFLRCHIKQPVCAGIALAGLLFKPHLFLAFGVALGIWTITRRQQRTFLALVGTAFLLGTIPLYWNPRVWAAYFTMMRRAGIKDEFIPTISSSVRLLFHWEMAQFLPAIAACIWAAVYFWRRAGNWDWNTDGALVMAVSVATAPYAWFTDELVLLPLVMTRLYNCSDRSARWFGVLNGIALVELLAGVGMPSGAYMWTPLAWLLWLALSNVNTIPPVRSDITMVHAGH